MTIQHENLASGKWAGFFLFPNNWGNIGSEVSRATTWMEKGNKEQEFKAVERALELFDLSLADKRWKYPALKEIARCREIVCDFFYDDNKYQTTAESLNKYFLYFGIAARN